MHLHTPIPYSKHLNHLRSNEGAGMHRNQRLQARTHHQRPKENTRPVCMHSLTMSVLATLINGTILRRGDEGFMGRIRRLRSRLLTQIIPWYSRVHLFCGSIPIWQAHHVKHTIHSTLHHFNICFYSLCSLWNARYSYTDAVAALIISSNECPPCLRVPSRFGRLSLNLQALSSQGRT